MEKVVKNLATSDPDDPTAAARNLNNFLQASRSMRDFVDKTPSVGRFSATLNEAGRLAKDLHGRTYPKNGLPEVEPDLEGRHEERGLSVPAGERLAAVGPLLKFQSARVKSKGARDVRAISNPDARADAIAAAAQNIGDLAPKDQSSRRRHIVLGLIDCRWTVRHEPAYCQLQEPPVPARGHRPCRLALL